jgi:hypothetical protein
MSGYEVSNTGLVRSKAKNLTLGQNFVGRGYKAKKSYLAVTLYADGRSRKHYVHALVAMAFLTPNAAKQTINHKNGIKSDNRVDNLEWMTMSENIRHAFLTGLVPGKKLRLPAKAI